MKDFSMKFLKSHFKRRGFFLKNKWILWCVFALPGAHFLTVYREPVKRVAIVWDPEYLLWLLAWFLLLVVTQGVCVRYIRYFFYLNLKKQPQKPVFLAKVMLFFIAFLFVYPFLLVQATAAAFQIRGISDRHPAYLDRELAVIGMWVFGYAVLLVFYHSYRAYLRAIRWADLLKKKLEASRGESLASRYAEDIDSTFMLVRKGDFGFRLKNNGSFVRDRRRTQSMKEMLEQWYTETSKGIYVNKKDIIKEDEENNKVYLSVIKKDLLRDMLRDHAELREINDAIKSEHGLLFLSPALRKKRK